MPYRTIRILFATFVLVLATAPYAEPLSVDDRRLVSDALARHLDAALPDAIGAGETVRIEPLPDTPRNGLIEGAIADVIVARGGRIPTTQTDGAVVRVRYAAPELAVIAEETGSRLIRSNRLVRMVQGVVLLEITASSGEVVGVETVVLRNEIVTPRAGTQDFRHADVERRVLERSYLFFQYAALTALLLTFALTVR